MCLAILALDVHPRYSAIIAANRDEYHARPSEPAHWWSNEAGAPILAGRDVEHGGTWLGLATDGRFAFVTNVREPGRHDPNAPSRGMLVPALLRDRRPIAIALGDIVSHAGAYNGFNLVGAEGSSAAFGSNRGPHCVSLARGIHGVSNAGLDTPWPKLVRAKAGIAAWVSAADEDLERLWRVLIDKAPAPDHELPDTGLTRERERLLSSPFIVSNTYGTRCSTLIALGRDGEAQFVERNFDAKGGPGARETVVSVTRPSYRGKGK